VGVHSTRAIIQSDMCANGSAAHYAIEYALGGGELSWKPAGEGTIEPASSEHVNGCGASATAHHLLPGSSYAIRIIGRNASGSAIEEGHFSTPGVEPAEILFLGLEKPGELGPEFINVELEVEDNGAPSTTYEVKLRKENGPFEAVAGGSGSISQPEDLARRVVNIEALTPSTEYTVQLTASNGVGATTTSEYAFTTRPATPQVGCCTVSTVHSSSVHLSGVVVPDRSATTWRLQVASSPAAPESEWKPVSEGLLTGGEADANFHEVQGDATGLAEGKTYYARLLAENTHGSVTSEVKGFETAGAPLVSTFATHAIHGESLRALGDVFPHGTDTHFHVEYVTQQQFEESGWAAASSTPEEDAGAGEFVGGFPTVLVGQDLPGLQPGVTYHYRLQARSGAPGSPLVDGNEQTLTAPGVLTSGEAAPCANESLRGGLSAQLPDCRAYEQVTPVEKGGAQDFSHYGLVTMGANVGEDGEHLMLHVPGTQWGTAPDPKTGEYYFKRSPEAWQMTSTRPVGEAGPDSFQAQVFNPDLTRVAVEANWATGSGSSALSNELDTGPPGGPYTTVASVPRKQSTQWVASSADAGKLILASEDHTLLGTPTGTTAGEDLYEYTEGQLHQVNLSPSGGPISTCGATIAKGHEGVLVGLGQRDHAPSSPHAVSADGSRVFFTDNCTHHLYVRVNGAETVDVGEYAFVAANPEGTRVLMEKSVGEGREFLIYDTETRTAAPLPGFSTHKPLPSSAMIVSDELTAVYFSTDERLTAEAPPTETETNLYRYDIAAQKLSFILQGGGSGIVGCELSVSPDGRYFYFAGAVCVRVRVAGLPSENQVYRYDSLENVVQCMSCSSPYKPEPSTDALLAPTFLGEPTIAIGANYTPQSTVASENGDYVFFDTPAALVPQDINGERKIEGATVEGGGVGELPSSNYTPSSDVYEWRKPGVDSCTHIQGCLSLISSGTPGYLVELLGSTPSGRDVFFTTHAELTRTDRDSSSDVYDARIGGGIQPPPPGPVECEGDACSTPASAPNDPTPSLLPFAGTGELAGALAPAKPPRKAAPKHAKACKAKAKRMCKAKHRKRKATKRAASRSGTPKANHR